MSKQMFPSDVTKDRRFVESLSRGLNVLRAFGEGSVTLGNQEIARLTQLPKATVSRMTFTLTTLGYLSYNARLEKYQLSAGVLALGHTYVSNLRVRQLARPYMDEFARLNNTSIGLTCRDRFHMIYVENRLPPEASLLRMEIGLKLPMATTAAGRAYCASLQEAARQQLLDALAESYGEALWPEKRAGLEQAVQDYRQHGFCLSLGDWDRNVNTAGVPITLADGNTMALTCAAPSYLVPQEKIRDDIAHQLVILAGDIQSLGS